MLLPTITNKQKEILLLLYRFRFLNRIQIQTLLNNKDYKNINLWLKDLTTKNYTGKIFERTPGINKPAIYLRFREAEHLRLNTIVLPFEKPLVFTSD